MYDVMGSANNHINILASVSQHHWILLEGLDYVGTSIMILLGTFWYVFRCTFLVINSFAAKEGFFEPPIVKVKFTPKQPSLTFQLREMLDFYP